MIDFTGVTHLTFDCYGTLIDWERGLLDALTPLVRRAGADAPGDDVILEAYARAESALERGPFRPYRDVVTLAALEVGRELGAPIGDSSAPGVAESIRNWPAFADTAPALAELAKRFTLAVLSNIDDDLFALSRAHLVQPGHADPVSHVITAQRVGSYKPAPGHFVTATRELRLNPENVVHVAQSLFHDIAPAQAMGWRTLWINRRAGRPGSGATPPATVTPDAECPDLRTLARWAAGS